MQHKVRTVAAGLAALATTATAAVPAFASQWAWTAFEGAGNRCRTQNGNVHSNWSALINQDPNTQTVWCPIDNPGGIDNYFPSEVSVFVNHGSLNPNACWLAGLLTPTTGFFYPVTTINTYNPQIDEVVWNVDPYSGNGGTLGVEVQCDLPSGAYVLAYDATVNQIWDWSTW